ncbi:MAG: hypothetical protein PHE67_11360 [Campylobacterales bacterium]|nr:hypothetical protein [Campylobacterales bacterium]
MRIEYTEVLNGFEYDEENAYWVRKDDGKAFHLFEKDENDTIRIAEVSEETCSRHLLA